MKTILVLLFCMSISQLQAMDGPELSEFLQKYIYRAVRNANPEMCSEDGRIDFSKLNEADQKDGFTPLMKQLELGFPASCGDPRVIEHLISKGARVDVKDRQGRGMIRHAMLGGNFDSIPLLLKHTVEIPVYEKSPDEIPPLVATINILYNRLDLEHQMCHTDENKIMALYKAATDFVPLLIKAGNHPDQRNDGGQTPLMLAAESSFDGIVKHLLDAGADQTLAFEGKMAAEYVREFPSFCYVGDPKKCREYLLKS